MPRYYPLKKLTRATRRHIVDGLFRTREYIHDTLKVPPRTVNDTLLLATWNIRDFGKRKAGPRLPEALYYMAEIISHFDLVAVQEVYENMEEFEQLIWYLGPNWDYIATDVTEGRPGNDERMVFLYDRRKVQFRNIAGEIVLPREDLVLKEMQFARTPFLVSFQSGWFKFNLCTVHIYYGDDSGEKFEQRVKEIDALARFIAKRAKKEEANYILLGDFNVISPTDETMQALLSNKFVIPEELRTFTNAKLNKFYDQIAFKTRAGELQLGDNQPNAGAVNYYEAVFRNDDWKYYFGRVTELAKPNPKHSEDEKKDQEKFAASLHTWSTKKSGDTRVARTEADREKFFGTWRTWQMSDHLPLWVELRIDFSESYLKDLRAE